MGKKLPLRLCLVLYAVKNMALKRQFTVYSSKPPFVAFVSFCGRKRKELIIPKNNNYV